MTQLQNSLSKIGTNAVTAHEAIAIGAATPVGHQANKGQLVQHYQLETFDGDRSQHYEIISKALTETAEVQLGNIVVSNNVTEREAAKQEFQSYIKELETINRELEEFTYSATHDM